MRFSDLLGSINLDFSSNFDMKKGIIVRRKNKSNFDIEVLDFNIIDALSNQGSEDDPLIDLHDEILIFSLGQNDDKLNDLEYYNPDEDMTHPSYGKEKEDDQKALENARGSISYRSIFEDVCFKIQDQMKYEDYKIEMHEAKKEAEYFELNKGKRRVLEAHY